MSFEKYEKKFLNELKTKELTSISITEISGMIDEKEKEVHLKDESIVQYALFGEVSDLYNNHEIQASLLYSQERAEWSKETVMKFRYCWHLLGQEKRKKGPLEKILELIEKDETLFKIIEDDFLLKTHVTKNLLKYGKKIEPFRKRIWDITKKIVIIDKSILITIMKEITSFIGSEKVVECRADYDDCLLRWVSDLEVQFIKENQDYFLDRLYEELTNVTPISGLTKQNIQKKRAKLALRIAEDCDDEAKNIHYAEKASVLFSDANDNEGKKRALQILSLAIRQFGTTKQQGVPLPVSQETGDNLLKAYNMVHKYYSNFDIPLERRLKALVTPVVVEENISGQVQKVLIYKPFPEKEIVHKQQKQFESSLTSQLMPSIHLSDNKVIGVNDESIQAKSLVYSTHLQYVVVPAMAALVTDEKFNLDFLMEYLKKSILITEEESVFVEEALEHFFNHKPISFFCVLTPTIESLLRKVYQLYNGAEVISQRKNSQLQTTVNLTDILKDKNVRESFSESFVSYLQYLLNDDTSSENIRNNVAHRLTGKEFYQEGRSLILLHLLLVLATYFQPSP